MAWLGRKLGYKKPEDWYQVKLNDFTANNGSSLLKRFSGNRMYEAVFEFLPNANLKSWLFVNGNGDDWTKPGKRREYMNWLGSELGYKTHKDWLAITHRQIERRSGAGFIKQYQGRKNPLVKILEEYFPEHVFQPWMFQSAPQGYWKDRENRMQYMEWLGVKLGFTGHADWYGVSKNDFETNSGAGLTRYIGGVKKAVEDFLGATDSFPWLFDNSGGNHWNDHRTRLDYLSWLAAKLGYSRTEDWYNVTKSDFFENHGAGFLDRYKNSPFRALTDNYDYDFLPWLFEKSPDGWSNSEITQKYLRWLEARMGWRTPEDWYQISQKILDENYGGWLYRTKYRKSPSGAAKDRYPQYDFKPWLFVKVTRGTWSDPLIVRDFLDNLGRKLGFESPEDWYNLTVDTLVKNNGGRLYLTFNYSIAELVMTAYPEWKLEESNFNGPSKRQFHLQKIVESLFPNESIRSNYKHPDLRFAGTNRKMEIDIFLEKLNLGFEYQGEQHYISREDWGGRKALEENQSRDQEKRTAFQAAGLKIVEIPYTWDGSVDAVIDALSEQANYRVGNIAACMKLNIEMQPK